ncbi:hypothetical protein IP69_08270 [Bosea sp. AAP35]|uniref:MFS transporter n=1 Tax=Bosea sp. AAP35 TaxID=1523417 RepID=UPI0006B9CD7A|nr:MFS transporter [Bosea sp. AAP35]KPF70916.1 hypothetical protein IP69_08270 [Bosea sp. AAP35]
MATGSTRADLPLKRRAVEAATLGLVAALSLLLLLYVAFEDARRTMERFHSEKMVAQGQVVQNALEGFTRPGLPLRHFVGFAGLVEPILEGDRLVESVAVYTASGDRVFAAGPAGARFGSQARPGDGRIADIAITAEQIRVVLPLDDRFERIGHVVLVTPRALIAAQVEAAFKPLLGWAMLAAAVFALSVVLLFPRQDGPARLRWIGIGFIAAFAVTATLVVGTLVATYSEAMQGRAKSLADSLGQRLEDIVAFNLSFADITGIGPLLDEYRQANPDIRAAALIVDGRVLVHTEAAREGVAWDHRSTDYEFAADLSPDGTARIQIRVALPRDVVFAQVLRSTKNFSALLVASGLFAALFVGLVHAFQKRSRIGREASDDEAKAFAIDLLKPAFFLAVFSEHLSYAFLPQMIQAATLAAGLSKAWASAPFTIYYLTFALALVAAGRLERRASARSLMVVGLALSAIGMTLMAVHLDFQSAVLARALSGIGQGILFIGTQAFVLTNSSQARRTRAGSIIVFGFQAGMIAGMAIGSLLVSSIESAGVFRLAAIVAAATALYVALALPATRSAAAATSRASSLWRDIGALMRDGAFARTALLIGIPAKAVLTGIVLLGLPLMLAQLGYAKEDIGQITMLYAGAVILASQLASARADRTADTRSLLFQGACLTALGLFLIASPGLSVLMAWDVAASPVTVLVVAGVVTIGIAHGFINAPIVTHVADTAAAGIVGATSAAATYRLLERIGHVMGPVAMMQIFAVMGVSWSAFAAIGLGILIMALLFYTAGRTAPVARTHPSAA